MSDRERQFQATVVVPVRNARAVITEQLEALLREARANDLEVIVVDDASTDGTPDVIAAWVARSSSGEFRLVRRDRRGGPNASRNAGVTAATTEFLLFCDGDDVVNERWASEMLVARGDNVILAGAYTDLVTPQTSASLHEWPLLPRSWEIPYAYGGNMAMNRSVVQRVGAFDEAILAGGSEFDFCLRAARQHGIALVPVPQAIVFHRVSGSAMAIYKQEFRRERGRCYLRRKFGKDVVYGRSFPEWVRDWLRLGRVVVASPFNSTARFGAARRAGSLMGRLWWSTRFGVLFL